MAKLRIKGVNSGITFGPPPVSTISFTVTYGEAGTVTLTQKQIDSITSQTPILTLTRYIGPGYSDGPGLSILAIGKLSQVSGNIFTSEFNQDDLIGVLTDGSYYRIGGSDGYSTGYATLSPYYDGTQGDYFIKWDAAAGLFHSAGSTIQYNPETGGNLIFNDYELGDTLYNVIDPLTDTITFLAGLPK